MSPEHVMWVIIPQCMYGVPQARTPSFSQPHRVDDWPRGVRQLPDGRGECGGGSGPDVGRGPSQVPQQRGGVVGGEAARRLGVPREVQGGGVGQC